MASTSYELADDHSSQPPSYPSMPFQSFGAKAPNVAIVISALNKPISFSPPCFHIGPVPGPPVLALSPESRSFASYSHFQYPWLLTTTNYNHHKSHSFGTGSILPMMTVAVNHTTFFSILFIISLRLLPLFPRLGFWLSARNSVHTRSISRSPLPFRWRFLL